MSFCRSALPHTACVRLVLACLGPCQNGHPKKSPLASRQQTAANNRDERTIEQRYQKKTQLEHILLRPDTYSECQRPANARVTAPQLLQSAAQHRCCDEMPGRFFLQDLKRLEGIRSFARNRWSTCLYGRINHEMKGSMRVGANGHHRFYSQLAVPCVAVRMIILRCLAQTP